MKDFKDDLSSTNTDAANEESDLPMLLVLNKYDLVEELIDEGFELEEYMQAEYIQKFAEDFGFVGAVCVSAKTGVGVDDAVNILTRRVLLNTHLATKDCDECPDVSYIYD